MVIILLVGIVFSSGLVTLSVFGVMILVALKHRGQNEVPSGVRGRLLPLWGWLILIVALLGMFALGPLLLFLSVA